MAHQHPVANAIDRWMDMFMYRSMQELLAFFHERGISMTQYMVCMRLYKQGPCAVSDLALLLSSSRAAASQLVDRMFSDGLVARTEGVFDRRVTQVALTSAGIALTHECIAARTRWLGELPELSAATVQTIVSGIDMLLEVVATAPPTKEES